MKNLTFTKLTDQYLNETYEVLRLAVNDAFIKDGVDMELYKDIIAEEIDSKLARLKDSLSENAVNNIFIALIEDHVTGVIGYGKLTAPVKTIINTQKTPAPDAMIVSTYVSPSFQRQGVGKFLFENLIKELKTQNLQTYALDSGFQVGKSFWVKMLGEPNYILHNYYEHKFDSYVWFGKLEDIRV
jgi:GNAT superfamily N-acetyltransferase